MLFPVCSTQIRFEHRSPGSIELIRGSCRLGQTIARVGIYILLSPIRYKRPMRTRQNDRKYISLPGRYSTGLGEPRDVILRDLSCGGCRFTNDSNKLAPGVALQIYVGHSGPHRAIVRWSKDGEVGLGFLTPLSQETFGSFQASHVPDPENSNPTADFGDMSDVTPLRFC